MRPPRLTRHAVRFVAVTLVCCLILLSAPPFTASAIAPRTLYVETTGSDAGEGTAASPFRTIQAAVSAAQQGDTVLVGAGAYPERVYVDKSGAADARLVIAAAAGARVTMRGFTVGSRSPQQYIRITGFEITDTVSGWRDKVGISFDGSYLQFDDNYVHDIRGDGIAPAGDAAGHSDIVIHGNRLTRFRGTGIAVDGSNGLVEDNDVSHGSNVWNGVADGDTDGFRFFGSNHVFRHNYVHDFLAAENTVAPLPHKDVWQTFATASNVLIEGNLVERFEGSWAMMEGNFHGPVDRVVFRNNILIGNANYGFHLLAVTNTTVVNNVLVNARYGSVLMRDASTGTRIYNNIFYTTPEATAPPAWVTDASSTAGFASDNNLVYPLARYGNPPEGMAEPHGLWGVDPMFVSPAMGDFRLAQLSRARDAANGDLAPGNDREGAPRIRDPRVPLAGTGSVTYADIGALEGTVPSLPTGTFSLNGGASFSSTLAVSADSSVSSAARMRFDTGSGFGAWMPYAERAELQLPLGDGPKSVTAQYADPWGYSITRIAGITLDTVAPIGAFALNGGAGLTAAPTVSADSSMTGATAMRFDSGLGFGSWMPYEAHVPILLPPGDGVKTVLAEFRDVAGNVSARTASVRLETAPPAVPSGLYASASDRAVDLRWNPEDAAAFVVWRSTSQYGPFSVVARLDGGFPRFADNAVRIGQTYYYRVTAANRTGLQSAPSATVKATPSRRVRRRPARAARLR